MILDIQLEVDDTPLLSRKCERCTSEDFRMVVHRSDEGKFYGNKDSQTSIPMAICLNCKRLVWLT